VTHLTQKKIRKREQGENQILISEEYREDKLCRMQTEEIGEWQKSTLAALQ
jgi:hypothetical protein